MLHTKTQNHSLDNVLSTVFIGYAYRPRQKDLIGFMRKPIKELCNKIYSKIERENI